MAGKRRLTDEDALRLAVSANPDDDLARLVYADWMEEHGRPERAEFVRIQIDRHREFPHVRGISWREYELLRAHELDWREELPPLLRTGAWYRRGFFHGLRCSIRSLIESTRDDELLAPIEHLSVTVDSIDPEWMAYHPPPLTLPLSVLEVECPLSVGPLLVSALVRYGPFPRLRRLRLRDNNLGDEGVTSLRVLSSSFPSLVELDLSHCGVGDRGAEELGEAEWVDQLQRVMMIGNPIAPVRQSWMRQRLGARLVI